MSRYNLYVNRRGRIQKKEYFNAQFMAWTWTNIYKEDSYGITAAMHDTQKNLWYVPGISKYIPKDISKSTNYTLKSTPETAVDPLIRAYALLS